jgi:ATP-dependent DNA ligase
VRRIDRVRPAHQRQDDVEWNANPGGVLACRRAVGDCALQLVLSDYTPIALTQVREPFHHDGWVCEEKVDGWRLLACKDGARVRLVSRNGRDHTRRFAGIADGGRQVIGARPRARR